jgi:hypothetical protein
LAQLKAAVPAEGEAVAIRTGARYQRKPAIVLAGGDGAGLMYAALDLADRIGWARSGGDPFQFARDAAEKPYLKERGVVMFTMNRAYFENRLLDERFWIRYFDMLAENRFNRLVLIFGYEEGGYMAPLYPYFFDVNGFPDVRVVGLTAEQQARNLKAMKTIAAVSLRTWDSREAWYLGAHLPRRHTSRCESVGIGWNQARARAGLGPQHQESRAVYRRRAQEVL